MRYMRCLERSALLEEPLVQVARLTILRTWCQELCDAQVVGVPQPYHARTEAPFCSLVWGAAFFSAVLVEIGHPSLWRAVLGVLLVQYIQYIVTGRWPGNTAWLPVMVQSEFTAADWATLLGYPGWSNQNSRLVGLARQPKGGGGGGVDWHLISAFLRACAKAEDDGRHRAYITPSRSL